MASYVYGATSASTFVTVTKGKPPARLRIDPDKAYDTSDPVIKAALKNPDQASLFVSDPADTTSTATSVSGDVKKERIARRKATAERAADRAAKS